MVSGSNSGTCKSLATKLASTAGRRGLGVEIKELNAVASGELPLDRPVAIVTTSYEGQVSLIQIVMASFPR
jgi:cytochrome P450/NADPH-cytochrome P450 reductase